MLQYYLRAAGIALSWVGTGRLIFTLACSDAEFHEIVRRFGLAVRAMQADGWWWIDPDRPAPGRWRQLRDLLQARCSPSIGSSHSPRSN
jgi:glutamate-1-semialdehyde 2,1-aminomutase